MSQAEKPSFITVPQTSIKQTVVDFLNNTFPHIGLDIWVERVKKQKVFIKETDKSHRKVTLDTKAKPLEVIGYYREVEKEPSIPFDETILELNEHFLIAHKPHFLPVMPGGPFVNECLQQRLIKRTGIKDLQAVHRLDRHTAGLVLFSTNPNSRAQYHQLFSEQKIEKSYHAIAKVSSGLSITGKKWHIKNYLTRGEPKFRFKNTNDPTHGQYAESIIECLEQNNDQALFKLSPITGRTHQLRLHMMEIGHPILNDRFYPSLKNKEQDDYTQPLKLLASTLSFIDPISHESLIFKSAQQLKS